MFRLTGFLDAEIYGNALNNLLIGNSGNDQLYGLGGTDTLIGGLGNDSYTVDLGDQIVERANSGVDSVAASVSYTLGENIEELSLTGFASLNGFGNSLDNKITGSSGNNILNGNAGADTLIGGEGDDYYYLENQNDHVVESQNGGFDTVESPINIRLTEDVEKGVLTGEMPTLANGNNLSNILVGNRSNNLIDGMSGGDLMIGGEGNDTYYVDDIDDKIEELVSGGIDMVESTINFRLPDYVENCSLAGSSAYSVDGNDQANILVGNDLNNALDGKSGDDTLKGGLGDDTYIINDSNDFVVEREGEGFDEVLVSVNYKMTAHIETCKALNKSAEELYIRGNDLQNFFYAQGGKLVLAGGLGGDKYDLTKNQSATAIEYSGEGEDTVIVTSSYDLPINIENLTVRGNRAVIARGNSLANQIICNSGSSVYLGGAGNDVYYINVKESEVTENADDGDDTIIASVTTTLPENVENLDLRGDADLEAVGNNLNNLIICGAGKNTLTGGQGIDTLQGGAGDDLYMDLEYHDSIIELDQGGFDTAEVNFNNFQMPAFLEKVVLMGSSDLKAFGNALDNIFVGNIGSDTLSGGLGDDKYYVRSDLDHVIESQSGGNDHVFSYASFNLSENVESLTLLGGATSGHGNALRNEITGNNLANILYGHEGNDVMYGGDSNDVLYGGQGRDYIVGGAGDDSITGGYGDDYLEGNEGNDTFYGSFNTGNDVYSGGDGFDQLDLGQVNQSIRIDIGLGRADIGDNATTSFSSIESFALGAANDVIIGDSKFSRIDSGIGADVITGGGGADHFDYSSMINSMATAMDTILDFQTGVDRLVLPSLALKDRVEDFGYLDLHNNWWEADRQLFLGIPPNAIAKFNRISNGDNLTYLIINDSLIGFDPARDSVVCLANSSIETTDFLFSS